MSWSTWIWLNSGAFASHASLFPHQEQPKWQGHRHLNWKACQLLKGNRYCGRPSLNSSQVLWRPLWLIFTDSQTFLLFCLAVWRVTFTRNKHLKLQCVPGIAKVTSSCPRWLSFLYWIWTRDSLFFAVYVPYCLFHDSLFATELAMSIQSVSSFPAASASLSAVFCPAADS